MDVAAFARVQKVVKDSQERPIDHQGESIRAADGTSTQFQKVWGQASNVTDVYSEAVQPLIENFLEGYNSALICTGESGSGKTHTLCGSNDNDHGEPGVLHWVLKDIFAADLAGSVGNKEAQGHTCHVTVSAWESHNELIYDLIKPSGQAGLSIKTVDAGELILEGTDGNRLAEEVVTDTQMGTKMAVDALMSRDQSITTFGPVRARSTSVLTLTLKQSFDGTPQHEVLSQFKIIITAGTECLAEKLDEVMVQEGPALNKAITTLSKVAGTMSSSPRNIVNAEYDESNVTKLIKDTIGGDCRTTILACVRASQTPALAHTLKFADQMSRVVNYPIYGDKASQGLQKRYKRLLAASSHGMTASAQPTSYGKGVGVDKEILRLNDLEGQVVQVNLELLRLQSANEELKQERTKRNHELKALMDEKTRLEVQQLQAEEDRLRSEKEKIDFQIKNAMVREESEKGAFEQANKYLLLEHDLIEASTLRDAMKVTNDELTEKVTTLETDRKQFEEEYLALRETLKKLKVELEATNGKKENIELELLRVSNARVALMKAKDGKSGAGVVKGDGSYGAGSITASETAANKLHAQIAAKLEDLSERNKKLQHENSFLQERTKQHGGVKSGDLQALQDLHSTQAGAFKGQLHAEKEAHFQATMDVRKFMRAVEEAKGELATNQKQIESLELDNERLQNDQARAIKEYRERLDKYVRDIGDFAAKAQRDPTMEREPELKKYVDIMIKDMITTYTFREQELERSLDRQRKERRSIATRCDQVVQAYQGCKLQMKAANVKIPTTLEIDLAGLVPKQGEGKMNAVARGSSAPTHDPRGATGRMSPEMLAVGAAENAATMRDLVGQFTKTVQRKLEKERASLLVRCTAAEQKSARLESYITTHMLSYQKEIMRLRSLMGERGKPATGGGSGGGKKAGR